MQALWELETALAQLQGVPQPAAQSADRQSMTQPGTMIPVSAAAQDNDPTSHSQEDSLQSVHPQIQCTCQPGA